MAMLINDVKTLKDVLGGIQKVTSWDTWKPFIRQAELDHIIPAIGEGFYDDLTDKLSQPNSLSSYEKKFVERIQITLGHYVEMESELAIMLQKGDGGIAVASPPNMQAPGKWAIVARIKEARDKADRNLERCLQYLEDHAEEFPTWKDSPAYTRDRELFLSSATEYTAYFGAIQNSRRLYVLLRPFIAKSELDLIDPLIGMAFATFLKSKLLVRPLEFTDEEKQVLRHIRQAVASNAFSRALPYLNLNGDLRVVSETDGIQNEDVLSEGRRNEMKVACDDEVRSETAKLKRYLDETASSQVLTPYFISDLYQPRQRKQIKLPDNSDLQKPFVL